MKRNVIDDLNTPTRLSEGAREETPDEYDFLARLHVQSRWGKCDGHLTDRDFYDLIATHASAIRAGGATVSQSEIPPMNHFYDLDSRPDGRSARVARVAADQMFCFSRAEEQRWRDGSWISK